MENLQIVVVKGNEYYVGNELMETNETLFRGCQNSRQIIKKANLTKKEYTYAKQKDGKWKETDGLSLKFDKILISKKWVEKNVDIPEEEEQEEEQEEEELPEIIELKKNEKFQDDEGNIIEIEVRGEREVDKCYFRVSDVADGFDIARLKDIILNKASGYCINIHYVFFNVPTINYGKSKNSKNKEILFLTYTGLLRVLFASHKKTVNKFVGWATQTLFTAHLGTKQQKQILVSKLINVTPETVKAVFNKSVTSLPCVYLFCLGKVKDLREVLDIGDEYDDDDFVYKYGNTDDLERRSVEHKRSFAKIGINDIQLSLFSFVDPLYISKAETDVKNCVNALELNFSYQTYGELAIIPVKKFKYVQQQYETIAKAYMGHITEMVAQIKDLQNTINLMESKMETLKERHENEILRMKLKMLQSKKGDTDDD